MKLIAILASTLALGLVWAGCSNDEESASPSPAEETEQVDQDEQASQEEARTERRRTKAQIQQARRERAEREQERAEREQRLAEAEAERQRQEAEEQSQDCHPSYEGNCLDPALSDYDCAGGSGDGPGYTGRVTVVGPDDYDLDRDGDGVGCE